MVENVKKQWGWVLALCAWLSILAVACNGDPPPPPAEDCALAGDEDGNGRSDCADSACAAQCQPVCGNGKREAGEICDDGNAASGDGCDANCSLTSCGNGIRTMNEGCDDGNTTSGDGCDINCMVTGCGNGAQSGNERCDDGNTTSGDGCDNNCTVTGCGNGVHTPGEGCDDGNPTDGDGCDVNCTVTACGNGIVTDGEACDDGDPVDGDGCDVNCTVTACGNGIVTHGEVCDDGNLVDGDLCDSNCTPTACGNGIVTGTEACDDGNATSGDGCDANCTATACGNGIVTPSTGETCDDGNLVDGDGCDSNCTSGCGNGIVTPSTGETCDDGNVTSGDGCDANCTSTACGNGVTTPSTGETCDDGNVADGDGCDGNCTVTGCGNGIETAGEECDDGNANDTDGCTNACTVQVCGDGEHDLPEACDDGNQASGDGCDANCTITGCGNGILTAGEACDDGNTVALDGCSPMCVIEPAEVEPNEDGSISTGASGITGNDFATANADQNGAFTGSVTIVGALAPAGDEDVFLFTNTTPALQAVELVTWNPALGINTSCGSTIDTGIQVRDASGASLASNDDRSGSDRCSRVTLGLVPGASVYAHVMEQGDDVAIAGYALQAIYKATACGDGLPEPGEQCDDGNTAGGDGCSTYCQIEVVCGDGMTAPGEQCDDGNAAGGDGCSATCQVETTAELEPNGSFPEAAASALQITGDRTVAGAISTIGDQDAYRVVVAAPTVVRFETFTSIFDCNDSMWLRLYDSAGVLMVSGVQRPCNSIAIFLTAGTYFVRVEEAANNETIPSYFLAVDYQIDRGAEPEPGSTSGVNDTTSTASTNLLDGRDVYVFGNHMHDGDIDVYAITVPAGARIRAEIIEGDRPVETCESGGIASRVTLFNHSLLQVADDATCGRGSCSFIDGTGSAPLHSGARNNTTVPKIFYLMVRASTGATGNAAAFIYRLQVSLR